MMRVAFDAYALGCLPVCGIKTYGTELINALGESYPHDEFQLLTYWMKKKVCLQLCGENPNIVIKNTLPNPLLLGKGVMSLNNAISYGFERIAASQYNLFHSTVPTFFPERLPRVVTTVHDLIPLKINDWVSQKSRDKFKSLMAIVMRKSQAIFADSKFTQSEIETYYPDAASKTMTVPLAAHPSFCVRERNRVFLKKYGLLETNRPYLLYVGQLQDRKNILGMLRIFESIAERYPEFQLVFIGQVSKSPYTDSFLSAHEQSKFKARMPILTNVENNDLVNFYNNAHGFVFYSFFEGFGLPIIEAMACGCPVATSRTSSMTEIADGAAIMVDPYDFDSMRDGMIKLIDNAELRIELREKGLKRAGEYSWKRTAELTYAGYMKALEKVRKSS